MPKPAAQVVRVDAIVVRQLDGKVGVFRAIGEEGVRVLILGDITLPGHVHSEKLGVVVDRLLHVAHAVDDLEGPGQRSKKTRWNQHIILSRGSIHTQHSKARLLLLLLLLPLRTCSILRVSSSTQLPLATALDGAERRYRRAVDDTDALDDDDDDDAAAADAATAALEAEATTATSPDEVDAAMTNEREREKSERARRDGAGIELQSRRCPGAIVQTINQSINHPPQHSIDAQVRIHLLTPPSRIAGLFMDIHEREKMRRGMHGGGWLIRAWVSSSAAPNDEPTGGCDQRQHHE